MATLGELKTRVQTECNRDDLGDELSGALTLAIQRAIEFYADDKFWFNSVIETAVTTGGNAFVVVPSTVRKIERLSIPAIGLTLNEAILTEVDGNDQLAPAGQPRAYAYYNDSVKLWPAPDQAYTLQIIGIADLPLLTTGDDYQWSALSPIVAFGDDLSGQNAWTNEAQDLIAARARFTLMRDQFRDPEGAELAAGAAQEAYDRLKRETARRLVTPLRMRGDYPITRTGFNATCGY